MTVEAKRAELRQRIAASRGRRDPALRMDEAPVPAPGKVAAIAGRHPLALIGGALAIGVLLGMSGKQSGRHSSGEAGGSGGLAAFFVDALFAIGIGLLEDVANSQIHDENAHEEDAARASAAATKNTLVRSAAGLAVHAGEKLRRRHGRHGG